MVARDQQLRAPSKAESLAYHGVGAECVEAQSRVTLQCSFRWAFGSCFSLKKNKSQPKGYKSEAVFFQK